MQGVWYFRHTAHNKHCYKFAGKYLLKYCFITVIFANLEVQPLTASRRWGMPSMWQE